MNSIPVSYSNRLVFNYLSATLHRGYSTATTLYQYIRKEALPGWGFLPTSGRNVFYKVLAINTLCVTQMPDSPPVGYKIVPSMEGLKNNDYL